MHAIPPLRASHQPLGDQRFCVFLPARLRCGGDLLDVYIRNISRRGLCAEAASAPSRGAQVELLVMGRGIVGRVVWSDGGRFGVEARDPIDIDAILGQGGQVAIPAGRHPRDVTPGLCRRGGDVRRPAERSIRIAARMQGVALAGAGCLAAVGIATIVDAGLSSVAAQMSVHGPA